MIITHPHPGQIWLSRKTGAKYKIVGVAENTLRFQAQRKLPAAFDLIGSLVSSWPGNVVYLCPNGYPGINQGTLVFAQGEDNGKRVVLKPEDCDRYFEVAV